jgi:hypothetical protein
MRALQLIYQCYFINNTAIVGLTFIRLENHYLQWDIKTLNPTVSQNCLATVWEVCVYSLEMFWVNSTFSPIFAYVLYKNPSMFKFLTINEWL